MCNLSFLSKLLVIGLVVPLAGCSPSSVSSTSGGDAYSIAPGSTLTSAIIAGVCNGTAPGTLVLPAGIVNFSSTLVVPSFCTIRGKGMGVSRLLLVPNMTTIPEPLMENTEAPVIMSPTLDQFIHLSGFTLDFDGVNQTVVPTTAMNGLWISNAENVTVDHVEVSGVDVHIGGQGWSESATDATYTHDISLTNNWFHGAGLSPEWDSDQIQVIGEKVRITGNTIGPSTDTGIAMWGGSTKNIVISYNWLIDNQKQQIVGAATPPVTPPLPSGATDDDVVISNNKLTETSLCAGGIMAVNESRWGILDNFIREVPPAAVYGTSNQIQIEFDSDVEVKGNHIIGGCYQGISVESNSGETTQGISVVGNTVRNTSYEGILLSSVANGSGEIATLSNVSVTGNFVIDPGSLDPIGIVIAQNPANSGAANYTGVVVSGNTIQDDLSTHKMTYGVQFLGFPVVSVCSNTISGYTIAAYSSTYGTLLPCI